MATALPNRRDKTRAQRIRDFLMTGPSPSLSAPQDDTERLPFGTLENVFNIRNPYPTYSI